MAEDKKLNNLDPGSEEGTTKDKTEGDKKDEGGKELIAGKFKSQDDLLRAYQELEVRDTKRSQEFSDTKERLAKLEGIAEAQKKPDVPLPLTADERKAMAEKFKEDFNKDPLVALHNFVSPYSEDARLAREEITTLKEENKRMKKTQGGQEARFLAEVARREDPELFDKIEPDIEKELREDKNLANYDNPYIAAKYKVLGKSYKNLAKTTDADRESHVEGSSVEPPKTDKQKAYVQKVLGAGDNTRL